VQYVLWSPTSASHTAPALSTDAMHAGAGSCVLERSLPEAATTSTPFARKVSRMAPSAE
jgi:hypothetical protein